MRYRTDKLLMLRSFSIKRKTFTNLIKEIHYASDCDTFSDMQHLTNEISESCKSVGFHISLN